MVGIHTSTSLDLTPVDFHLCVYVTQIRAVLLFTTFNTWRSESRKLLLVASDVCRRLGQEMEHRLDACRATNGKHIELP
jgi:hypothetical protein